MKKHVKILRYFIYFSILVIGVVIGIAIRHYYKMPLSDEINLIDLATLVVTVFLAVYVPEVLDRKLQDTRDKKTLIESRIAEFQALVKKINTLVQEEETRSVKAYLELKNLLDVAGHKLDTIISLVGYAKFKQSYDQELKHLKSLTREHKALLGSQDTDASTVTLTPETRTKEETLYNELDKASSLLIFSISDAD